MIDTKVEKKKVLYKKYPKYSVYDIYKKVGIDKNGQPIWQYLYKKCEMNIKTKFDVNEEIIANLK